MAKNRKRRGNQPRSAPRPRQAVLSKPAVGVKRLADADASALPPNVMSSTVPPPSEDSSAKGLASAKPASDSRPRQKRFGTWFRVVIGALAAATGIVGFVVPDIAGYARIMICLLFCVVGSYLSGVWHFSARKGFVIHAAAVAALGIVWFGIYLQQQPSEAEKQTAIVMEETRTANIWVGRDPVMFPRGKTFLEDHFEAFDLTTTHSWDELAADQVATIPDLAVNTGLHAGHAVLTLGRVGATNRLFDDQWVVQVTPLTTDVAASARTRQLLSSSVSDQDADTLLRESIPNADRVTHMLYVRITLPPFGTPFEDETVLIKGTPIAYGRTHDRLDRAMDVAYLVGSNIGRFYDSPAMAAPEPSRSETPSIVPK